MYSESQLGEVAGLFGLSIKQCSEMSGGSKWMGRRYSLDTDAGKFFLKVRSEWWPTRQAEYVCGLLRDLNAEGFPVPSLRQTLEGDPFALWQEHVCECHAYVDGQVHTLGNVAQVASAGRMLSRFHSVTATRARPEHLLPDSCGYPGEERVAFFVERVKEFFAADSSALGALDEVISRLRAVPVVQDTALVHGDYHPTNMIFREDEIAAVCDFDMVQEAPCAFDLGYFLYRAAGRPGRAGGGPAKFDRSVAAAFLDGYQQNSPDACPNGFLRDVSCEALRFAWFNVLLLAHNTRDAGKLREWMADTSTLEQDAKQWTEENAEVGQPAE